MKEKHQQLQQSCDVSPSTDGSLAGLSPVVFGIHGDLPAEIALKSARFGAKSKVWHSSVVRSMTGVSQFGATSAAVANSEAEYTVSGSLLWGTVAYGETTEAETSLSVAMGRTRKVKTTATLTAGAGQNCPWGQEKRVGRRMQSGPSRTFEEMIASRQGRSRTTPA